MRLYASQGARGRIIDLDTGKFVPKVIWLDLENGELEAYRIDGNGQPVSDGNGNLLTYYAKGRFRFETVRVRESKNGSVPISGAPKCVKCESVLTLPGDDLCPACRAKDRGQRNRFVIERHLDPLEVRPCDGRCGRLAVYAVSDEVTVTPESKVIDWQGRKTRALFDRGATVGRRFYCSFCFKPPRILDARGEVIQELDTKVRPD